MVLFICCMFVLGLQCVVALPYNESDIASTSLNDRCMCDHDVKQLYAGLKEVQKRILAMENVTPIDRIASDEPNDINTRTVYPEVVGFTVSLTDKVYDLPVGSTVLFDSIYYNSGSGYDTSTGIFTCPRSGMYLFAIFVEAVNASPAAALVLTINGNHRLDAVSERYATGHDSTGGNVLVQHIQEGDRVWVETYELDNQDLFAGFTTFSGVLIQST